jgi:hypothetical protein
MSYGEYTSVNDMPMFADYIAEHGPLDPQKRVTFAKNSSGHYTPRGEEHPPGIDGATTFWFDLSIFDGAEPFEGIEMASVAQFMLDYDGLRYVCYLTPAADTTVMYSANYLVLNPYQMFNVQLFIVPGDHPLLMCCRPNGIPGEDYPAPPVEDAVN